MSRKVIEVRGRVFAIECRAGQMKFQLSHYAKATDTQLDMYAKEYKKEQ